MLARVESRSRKNMLNSDSQSFAGIEDFLRREEIIRLYLLLPFEDALSFS